MRFFAMLLVVAGPAGAQQIASDDNPQALLLAVRQKVMQTVDRLPKYLCTETVERATFQPEIAIAGRSCDDLVSRRNKSDWKVRKHTSDRLRLDVAISGSNEMYSWVGEDRFQERRLADLVGSGATSTGAFSGILASVFGTNSATFTYNGDLREDGRSLVEFGFQVPQEKSTFRFGTKLHHAIVGYSGTFLINPATFDLVRLTVHDSDFPPELNACQSTTTLDYGTIRIHDSEFLIPKSARWQVVNSDGTELDSHLVFSTCHEFLGKSTVSFEEQSDTAQAAALGGKPVGTAFPADVSFTLALASPIYVETAAAGDPFKAVLASNIKAKHGEVLAAKGAVIAGRILRIERTFGEKSDLLALAIRLETIQIEGTRRSFHARLASVVRRRQKQLDGLVVRQDLGSFDDMVDPENANVGMVQFQDVTSDFVIRPGFEIEGRTE